MARKLKAAPLRIRLTAETGRFHFVGQLVRGIRVFFPGSKLIAAPGVFQFIGKAASFVYTQVIQPPPPGESADGTKVPPTASITDSTTAVWTLSGVDIFRNGVQVSGAATLLKYFNHQVYALGTGGSWFLWNGTGFVFFSTTEPGTSSGGTVTGLPAPWTTGVPVRDDGRLPVAEISLDWEQSEAGPDYNAHWICGGSYVSTVATIAGGDATKVIMRTPMAGDFPGCVVDRRNGMFYWFCG